MSTLKIQYVVGEKVCVCGNVSRYTHDVSEDNIQESVLALHPLDSRVFPISADQQDADDSSFSTTHSRQWLGLLMDHNHVFLLTWVQRPTQTAVYQDCTAHASTH